MATAKWVQKIKDHLARNPLYFKAGEHVPTCLKCLHKQYSALAGTTNPPGCKKLALYQVTNYSNLGWNKCHSCGEKYD